MSDNDDRAPVPETPSAVSGASSSTGLDVKIASTLSYSVGWVTGLVFFLIEKQSAEVRFHALQSMVAFGGLNALLLLTSLLIPPLSLLVWIGAAVLWVVVLFKAYQGDHFELPFAGKIAQQNSALR